MSIQAVIDKQDLGVRRAFRNLPQADRDRVERAYARHAVCCRKAGIAPEPRFIAEFMHDLQHGMIDPDNSPAGI